MAMLMTKCSWHGITLTPELSLIWPHPTCKEGFGEVSSWNVMVSEFSKLPFSDLQCDWYYSNFQNFYVLPYIRFLLLVKLKCWLAEVTFFPLSIQEAFQHSRHFRAMFSP